MTPVNPIVVTTSPFFLLPENKNDLPPRIDTYKRVDDLYKVYKSNVHCMDNWDYAVQVIECAQFAFGNIKDWAEFHVMHANLSDTAFMYLIDTVKFIMQGKRKYPFVVLAHGIEPEPGLQVSPEQRKQRLAELKLLIGPSPAQYLNIGQWLSHAKGLEDLLRTLVIMFTGIRSATM